MLVISFVLFIHSINAFHAKGHFATARIAQIHLDSTAEGKKIITWVESLLKPLSDLCGEDKHPLVECATWSDKIKHQDWRTMGTWHFTQKTLLEDGYVPPKRIYDKAKEDIVRMIYRITKHLKSKGADAVGKSKNILGKSLGLRNLIHFLGDIHQPLHAVNRFSAAFPGGDLGGNLFTIDFYGSSYRNNLHYLWDHLLESKLTQASSPFSESEWTECTTFSQGIINQFKDNAEYKEKIAKGKTSFSWASESYYIAKYFAYKEIKAGEKPSATYLTRGREIVLMRLALGGKRLADVLTDIYKVAAPKEVQAAGF